MPYYTNTKIDGVNTMDAADLEAIETGFASVEADLVDLSGITDAPTALTNLGLTALAAELNITDGSTAATAVTLVDADRVVVNDGGLMKQVDLTDFETYFESALDTLANVTTVGALNSGSITSGFGAIDVGASNITTTGNIAGGAITQAGISVATLGANIFTVNQTIKSVSATSLLTIDAITGQNSGMSIRENGLAAMLIFNDAAQSKVIFKKYAANGIDGVSLILMEEDGDINVVLGQLQQGSVNVATVNTNWATTDITSGVFADARVQASNVTQHVASIDHDSLLNFVTAEHLNWSADLGATNIHVNNVTASAVTQHVAAIDHNALLNFAANEHLDWTADLGATNIHVNNVTAAAVTQHVASIDHDALLNFAAAEHLIWSNDLGATNLHVNNVPALPTSIITTGTFADALVAESNVTQHQAALTITESQVSDFPLSRAIKTSDEIVNNSAVLQNDDQLSIPVAANKTYIFEMYFMSTSGTTPDLSYAFALPAGATGYVSLNSVTGPSLITGTFVVLSAGARTSIRLKGYVTTSATSGNIQFRWAQDTADVSNTTVHAGSWMKLTE